MTEKDLMTSHWALERGTERRRLNRGETEADLAYIVYEGEKDREGGREEGDNVNCHCKTSLLVG